ncbi:MAG TPA: VWA domain-containing protein [Gemmataceae bacterium]|jgi:Ca-activated chloride channel family protein|nr:VWA domain-containing protein [Gemmataceae bacterium]
MPTFAYPMFLFSLLSVPLLVWSWLYRRRGALRFPDTVSLAHLPPGRSRWARWGGAGLRGAALAALVIAAAGPRWPDEGTRVDTEGIAIVMVVDVSGSMAEPDFLWEDQRVTRLEAVKRAFGLFVEGGTGPKDVQLEGRHSDLVGLVTFATRPDSVCPLTLSHGVLLQMLEREQPRSLPTESQTNIGDAIGWGLQTLESAGTRRKVMVLLSDGEHNVPPPALKPRQAAQLAANLRVQIYTIDAGGDAPVREGGEETKTESMTDRATGVRTLQAVAKISGGHYFRAPDSSALLAACKEIDRLERRDIKSYQYRRYYEGYPWFGLAALVFFVGVHMLELTVWRRVP